MMVISSNTYTLERQAMAALRLSFPDEKVTSQGFNNEYIVEFRNGKYGYCGISNGPLECDMYWSIEHMDETGQPYETIEIASVYDSKIFGYNGEWIENQEGGLDLDCGSMHISDRKLYVSIDRGDYLVATGEIHYLKRMSNKYMMMLDAVTSTGMIDGPDVFLKPETMKLQLVDSMTGNWGKDRCFYKTIRDM